MFPLTVRSNPTITDIEADIPAPGWGSGPVPSKLEML